jgi:hypothetical protein
MIPAVGATSTASHLPFGVRLHQSIAEKVRWLAQKIFGSLLRVMIFQLGTYKNPFAYFLIRTFQFATSDPYCIRPVNYKRLEKSKNLLLLFGGAEAIVIPQDRKAEIHLMTFKASEFLRRIEQLGGQKVSLILHGQQRWVILPKPDTTPKQFQDLSEKLRKFFLPEIKVQTTSGIQTGILLPESPPLAPNQTAPLVVRFHSPGRSMAMDRKFIGLHLGAGYDICISDPRGTIDSKGTPSEGGYYLDAEAVFQHVLDQGYPKNRIYISGYCAGAAVGAHLKRKYHQEGVHFIAENPFHSLHDTIRAYHRIGGRTFAPYALPALQSTDPAIRQRVRQDGFDTTVKFHALPPSSGQFILIYPNNDRTLPKDSVDQIRQAIGRAGPYFSILRHHPNPKVDGHMQPPTEDPAVWHRYVEIVT